MGTRGCASGPSTEASLRKFRFSRLGPKGQPVDTALLEKVATAMTARPADPQAVQPVSADPPVPAGYTYLGQFVDHDLTLDNTAKALGENVTVNELLQGRSPALDLDSVYGRGPHDADDDRFYAPDKVKLKVGITAAIDGPGTNVNLNGYDLPRVTQGSKKAERQAALMPDHRNDENLAVAQTHLAFLRFHNRVVDELADRGVPSTLLFERARDQVVRHYQWLLKTDFLPRIVDQSIVDDVFTNGRRFFELPAGDGNGNGRYGHQKSGDRPTMPIEFSVAAYRLGHSMVRAAYDWNRIFSGRGGSLRFLFIFSGTSGNFDPFGPINDPESGLFERLPTNWTVDWRRMYDFAGEANRPDLAGPNGVNVAQRIDTLLVNPLAELPEGTFGFGTNPTSIQLNLAFRNLVRANMVSLASGQEMAEFLGLDALKPEEILDRFRRRGAGRADRRGEVGLRQPYAAVVLHPARGRAAQRPADRGRRPPGRRGVPPGHGGQPDLDRAGPGLAAELRSGRRDVPDGRPVAVRVRGPQGPARAAGRRPAEPLRATGRGLAGSRSSPPGRREDAHAHGPPPPSGHRPDQGGEDVTEHRVSLGADLVAPARLHLVQQIADAADHRVTGRSAADDLGPAVAGVAVDHQEASRRELRDELAQALLADPEFVGEVDDAAARRRDDVEDAGLRRAEVGQRRRRYGVRAQPAVRAVQQVCHVGRWPDIPIDVRHGAPYGQVDK